MSKTDKTLVAHRRSRRSADPAADLDADTEATPPRATPRTIGPYRLVRPLGTGGMGEVYLAEQTAPITRQVAVKLIRAGQDRQLAHRFELERRALARMSHPAIAQVYEAGDTDEGIPFLVMELVPGEPIDVYCDRRRLPIAERLRLLAEVADGIHHAHQKGVLHRDVKPGNVLVAEVDGAPTVKIIDFGIAKALEPSGDLLQLTQTGGFLGTPAYLSPEAVISPGGEDVDIRSDVYSLGVLLYRLTVGSLPFDEPSPSWIDIVRTLAEEEPQSPSARFAALPAATQEKRAGKCGEASAAALLRRLRGDLDAVALEAVARERDRRYGSAAELAADLRRHLADEPVAARPPSRAYLTRKFLRRHRVATLGAALVVLSLIGGLVARTLEARRADREAAAARQAQAETEQVVDFLVDMFAVSDPGRSLGETITARQLLDDGATRIRRELAGQPAVKGRLLDTMGVVYGQLGLYNEAAGILDEALALRRSTDAPLAVAETLTHLANVRWQQNELDTARAFLERALALYETERGPAAPEVAEVLDQIGMVYELEAAYDEAETYLRRGLAIREEHATERPEDLAESLDHLGILYVDQGRAGEASEHIERALAIREATLGPAHPDVADTLNSLGLTAAAAGRNDEAEAHLRRALAIREKALGPDHADVAQVLNNLALILDEERAAEIVPLLERALAIWEARLGPDHPRVAIVLTNLADHYRREGRFAEAVPYFHRAREIFVAERGQEHPFVAYPLKGLGDVYAATGREREAEAFYRRALAIRRAALAPDAEPLRVTVEALAELLRRQGRDAEAAEVEALVPPAAEAAGD